VVQHYESSEAGKWLGLLKEAGPNLARVAVIFNPEITATGPELHCLVTAPPTCCAGRDDYSRSSNAFGMQDGDDGVAHWCLEIANRQAIGRCWI
jgi:hypothetical protein